MESRIAARLADHPSAGLSPEPTPLYEPPRLSARLGHRIHVLREVVYCVVHPRDWDSVRQDVGGVHLVVGARAEAIVRHETSNRRLPQAWERT